jgi:hypothetical protein
MDNLYLKSLSEDNEFICDNKNMKEILLPNENILFSNKIQRIKKNTQEERIIVLTDRYLYNLRKKKYHNKADIRNITGITVSKKSNEFVVHTCEMEDDFHYDSDKRSFILELIARIYYCQTRKKIDLSVVEPGFLDDYVTQKSDKKNNKGKTKFDPHFFIDIDHYLYGNLEKSTFKTLASITKYLKSEIIFYNPVKCENLDLKKLRIENFRHLEVLSLSVYGDVILAEYIPTGEIYFIRTINSSDTNEFCLNFDLLMEINMSHNFPFMAQLDFMLKTQTVTYLISTFKDNFEGGYLISKVYDCGIFSENIALFFGSQIALIIDYFHKKKISFLGFSPQNFLIGPDGYIKFVDYEMDYNTVKQNADKICLYDGPEEYNLIQNDWYNFGVIMYEMLFGIPPSFINNVLVFQKYFTVSEKAKIFLENMLKKEVYENFSLDELKKTDLFKDTNFDDILAKKINIGLRFLGTIDEIPMMPGFETDNQVKKKSYNILNFNSIDLEC